MTWQNRIVKSDNVNPKTLVPNPDNWRLHPDQQKKTIDDALKEIGWIQQIIVNIKTGRIIDGHMRVALALEKNLDSVPVVYVDLSEEEEKKALATFDPIGAIAETDFGSFEKLMEEVSTDSEWLEKLMEGTNKNNKEDIEVVEDNPVVEISNVTTNIKFGDLIELNHHRLVCGDSKDLLIVQKLLKDFKPKLMVTDPPYGVNYDPQWRPAIGMERVEKDSKGLVTNDDINSWEDIWKVWSPQIIYCWHAGKYSFELARDLLNTGYEIISQIIWAKPHFVISRGDYHWQHEPCWYAVKKGSNHNWQGARDQSTLWEIAQNNPFANKDQEEKWGHGTQKPVEVIARSIKNNSAKGDIICDPFLGSGTTLIGCEQLGRTCYGAEIEPKYCQIIVDRYKKYCQTNNLDCNIVFS